jgi:hypothetical protein
LLAPACVAAASLIGRRFGPRVAGLVGGTPVVAGPILLVLALQHDAGFGAGAAAAALGGLFATSVFVVVYARTAVRFGPVVCLLAGWGGYLATIAVLAQFHVPRGVLLAMACGSFLLGARLLPDLGSGEPVRSPPPAWDLPLRMAMAAALVLIVSAVSSALGARASGLLATFPVMTAVLAAFTQHQDGIPAVEVLLRGFLLAYFSMATFAFTASLALTAMPLGWAFALALVASLAVGGAVGLSTSRQA